MEYEFIVQFKPHSSLNLKSPPSHTLTKVKMVLLIFRLCFSSSETTFVCSNFVTQLMTSGQVSVQKAS